jgi:hypothetical protein
MQYRNLTPHTITIYTPNQFTNLEWDGKTCYYADGVEGYPVLSLPSEGTARIYQQTTLSNFDKDGVPLWITYYGDLEFPDNFVWGDDEILVVSLFTKMNAHASEHPTAKYMATPFGVVRSRENGSLVLGFQGLTY